MANLQSWKRLECLKQELKNLFRKYNKSTNQIIIINNNSYLCSYNIPVMNIVSLFQWHIVHTGSFF